MENENFEIEQDINLNSEIPVDQIISGYTEELHPGMQANLPKQKVSPFANSPYESNFTNAYQAPVAMPKQKKVKAAKSGRGKRILAAVLTLALVAGSCGITAALVNDRWEKKTQILENSIAQKLDSLQKQVDAAAASDVFLITTTFGIAIPGIMLAGTATETTPSTGTYSSPSTNTTKLAPVTTIV